MFVTDDWEWKEYEQISKRKPVDATNSIIILHINDFVDTHGDAVVTPVHFMYPQVYMLGTALGTSLWVITEYAIIVNIGVWNLVSKCQKEQENSAWSSDSLGNKNKLTSSIHFYAVFKKL